MLVWLCYINRKCVVPFEKPCKTVKWPGWLYVWVGPDGRPIPHKKEKLLLKWREKCLVRQNIKKWASAKRHEAGVLSTGSPEYPKIVVDPPPPFFDAQI